jgi:hypothetical protein
VVTELPVAPVGNPDAPDLRLDLTARQRTVINLLLMGRTVSGAAAAVGVHRNTVHRWKTEHPAFAAELRRRQQEVWEATSHRIRCLMLRAVRVAERALEHPEHAAKTALRLLAQGGMKNWIIPPAAPTDERAVTDEMALARRALQCSTPTDPETPVTPDERSAVRRDAPRDDETDQMDRPDATDAARGADAGPASGSRRADLAEIDVEPAQRRDDRYRRDSVEQIVDELLYGDGDPDRPPPRMRPAATRRARTSGVGAPSD